MYWLVSKLSKKPAHIPSRMRYTVFALLTIPLGLLSRNNQIPLPYLISEYGGDTLWALLVYFCFRILLPGGSALVVFAFTLLFSFFIEFSQIYQAPWINSIRANRLGGLILGYGFKFSDLICYSAGAGLGIATDFSYNVVKSRG